MARDPGSFGTARSRSDGFDLHEQALATHPVSDCLRPEGLVAAACALMVRRVTVSTWSYGTAVAVRLRTSARKLRK